MTEPIPREDSSHLIDFTSHIPDNLMSKRPTAQGAFGDVYRCTIRSDVGKMEVAVKVFRVKVYYGRPLEELPRAVRRELKVCCGLKHPNIVPLLGTARVESPFPALISRWMVSGTLFEYLKEQAATISPSARDDLVKGIAKGLDYLHTNNIIHGDFHPGNVLLDDSGSPCIADFGLATVAEDPELQWGPTTVGRHFDSRWRAPEVLGIHGDPQRPTFKSDIYSFGSVMFFIVSGDEPWKGKNHTQIIIELSKGVTHSRPQNILDYRWHLIQKCWSFDPRDRPKTVRYDNVRQRMPIQNTTTSRGVANFVIFGETGAGKSSIINLMAGKQVARVSPDSHRCTMQWTEYRITIGNTPYRMFDTVGLDEPTLEAKDYLSAITNAYELINKLKEDGGINLLLFCIRRGRVTATMQCNYRLFFEFLCDEKVPLALVVTNLERENNMEEWYARNEGALEKYGIRSIGHACITAAVTIDGRDREKYEESKKLVSSIIQNHCNALAEGWTGEQGSLISKCMDLVTGRPKKTDVLGVLTRRCGMNKTAALQIVQSLNDN